MREREALVREFPQGDGKLVEVTVSYHKGGLSRRGYWMHIQPMRIERSGIAQVRSYFPSDGYRMFLLEAKRFSQSAFNQAQGIAALKLDTDDAVRARIAYAAGTLAEGGVNAATPA